MFSIIKHELSVSPLSKGYKRSSFLFFTFYFSGIGSTAFEEFLDDAYTFY